MPMVSKRKKTLPKKEKPRLDYYNNSLYLVIWLFMKSEILVLIELKMMHGKQFPSVSYYSITASLNKLMQLTVVQTLQYNVKFVWY